MQPIPGRSLEFLDLTPDPTDLASEVIEALSAPQKWLPCKLFYDEEGSRLFERICELPEYYPTRTEVGILRHHSGEMAQAIGRGALLVEFGSGSSQKTRLLLDALIQPAGYVPVDISKEQLRRSAEAIAKDYPRIEVRPVCGDYNRPLDLPRLVERVATVVVFFPGSTIGNFEPEDVVTFLRRIGGLVGKGGGLLIGVDLKKDREILEAAYDDAEGITARFNLNALAHLNRVLGADFDLAAWRHVAFWSAEGGRVEIHLESRIDQRVTIRERTFRFAAGETIHTENSYKYAVPEFHALAARAGFAAERVWTDSGPLFSVHYLKATG